LEEAFQGHSFCLEQGLGLNLEQKTGTNCTSALHLETNPIFFFLISLTETQTWVLGCFPNVGKAELEQGLAGS
jgi:hypothetical protein